MYCVGKSQKAEDEISKKFNQSKTIGCESRYDKGVRKKKETADIEIIPRCSSGYLTVRGKKEIND